MISAHPRVRFSFWYSRELYYQRRQRQKQKQKQQTKNLIGRMMENKEKSERHVRMYFRTIPCREIGHFWISFGPFFKASPVAHSFIWKLVFICMWMKTNFHMKGWAPGLALKKRPKVIGKWPIRPCPTAAILPRGPKKQKSFVLPR